MRIVIMGSGGLGGLFGGLLQQAGADVLFITRGKHLEAMQAYRGNDYSVPVAFGHHEVQIRGYVHEV
jgi:ketopantoate reductase